MTDDMTGTHRLRPVTVIAALLAVMAQAQGQQAMTLKECMEYAISRSAEVRIQQADNSDSRIDRRDAILSAFTPSVNAEAHAYSNFGRTIDPESNTYVSTTSFNNAYGVSAGFTIFNGFKAVNNMKITRTAQAMGIREEQRIKDGICLQTMQAYYNVVYYSQLAEILESQVSTAREALLQTERQEELGQKGYADVIQMKADLADKEYSMVSARNSLNDAYITLKNVMFWPVDDSLEIVTSIAESQSQEPVLQDSTDTGEIIDNAISTLPEIFIARGRMENARRELKTARWQLSPSLSLYGGWSTSYYTYPGQSGYVPTPFWSQFRNNGGEYVQLTLSIPIFNALSRHSSIRKKKNAFSRAEAEYDQKVREVEAEVSRAVQDRDGALSAFFQAERRAAVQEEAFRLNSRKYSLGLISSIEYQSASEKYLEAEAERLNSLLQYYIKKRVVAYYGGTGYLEQEY